MECHETEPQFKYPGFIPPDGMPWNRITNQRSCLRPPDGIPWNKITIQRSCAHPPRWDPMKRNHHKIVCIRPPDRMPWNGIINQRSWVWTPRWKTMKWNHNQKVLGSTPQMGCHETESKFKYPGFIPPDGMPWNRTKLTKGPVLDPQMGYHETESLSKRSFVHPPRWDAMKQNHHSKVCVRHPDGMPWNGIINQRSCVWTSDGMPWNGITTKRSWVQLPRWDTMKWNHNPKVLGRARSAWNA